MIYSRRQFTKLAGAGLALSPVLIKSAFAKQIDSKIDGVQLGVQSYSFRDLPIDEAIQAMAADGLGACELFSPHIEAGGIKSMDGLFRNFEKMTPDARKAAFEEHEKKLHDWRMTVPLSYFEGVRKKFNDAGISLYAYNLTFGATTPGDEMDRGFQMAKALGVGIITTSTTVPVAQKMVPYAEKHNILVAVHGHSDVKDPNQFATPVSFAKAIAMSKQMRINLDIGHFTAANFDAVDFIQQHHDQIVLLHLKDRKKNDGPNTPWGEGDTPITPVLQLLKQKQYPIPAFIEYEYKGTGTSREEVAKCYQYAKDALNS